MTTHSDEQGVPESAFLCLGAPPSCTTLPYAQLAGRLLPVQLRQTSRSPRRVERPTLLLGHTLPPVDQGTRPHVPFALRRKPCPRRGVLALPFLGKVEARAVFWAERSDGPLDRRDLTSRPLCAGRGPSPALGTHKSGITEVRRSSVGSSRRSTPARETSRRAAGPEHLLPPFLTDRERRY